MCLKHPTKGKNTHLVKTRKQGRYIIYKLIPCKTKRHSHYIAFKDSVSVRM